MELKTQRLTIRFINEEDYKGLTEIWQDFNNSEYAQYDVPHTESNEEVREKTKRWAKASPGREHMFFAICLDGQFIGYVDFHKNPDGYELGYCFHSQYHNKGYARESLNALFDHIADGKKTRFVAGTALNNVPYLF